MRLGNHRRTPPQPDRPDDSLARRSARLNPTVLFVDTGILAPFVQLAVALRRWGYRTIRVTTARRSLGSSLTARIAFDRVLYLDPAALTEMDSLLADELLVDVHCAEPLAVEVYESLGRLPGAALAGWSQRLALIDKWNVVQLLDAAGIDHPDCRIGTTPAPDAVAALGLPIVVKPRVGSNGRGVFVAESLEQLESCLRTLDGTEMFFESFVVGTAANYCAVVGDHAERDMTYRTLVRGVEPWSPSTEIACYVDDELIAVGRRLASALPSKGLLNVDAIRDSSGRYVVHDVNLRVWGAFFASWSAGFDLTGAYLQWLGDQVRVAVGDQERAVQIFPDFAGTALLHQRRADGVRALVEQAGTYRRLLGTRYVLREVLLSARSIMLGDRPNHRGAARGGKGLSPDH